jgi:hypothetical protein
MTVAVHTIKLNRFSVPSILYTGQLSISLNPEKLFLMKGNDGGSVTVFLQLPVYLTGCPAGEHAVLTKLQD